MEVFIEIIGWVGSVLVVGAYCLNLYGVIKTNSMVYILSNLFGGAFFIVNTFVHHAYPSMIVNIIWVVIAVSALFKKDKKEIN